jgi:hypothetical protein
MSDKVSYRIRLPKPVLAAVAAEARRRSSTPSRVVEGLIRNHLAEDVAIAIARSIGVGTQSDKEVP